MSGQTTHPLRVQRMGLRDYRPTLTRMQRHIATRSYGDMNELWLLQHRPVITTGVRGRHLPPPCQNAPADTEVIQTDRGGLTTAHNPGQAVAYCLWQIDRLRMPVPQLVRRLEQCVINTLRDWQIEAGTMDAQPGVYVRNRKIASIGLRVRQGWCYHGLSVNVCNDLSLFERFEPCGISGLQVASLRTLGVDIGVADYFDRLLTEITRLFPFTAHDDNGGR